MRKMCNLRGCTVLKLDGSNTLLWGPMYALMPPMCGFVECLRDCGLVIVCLMLNACTTLQVDGQKYNGEGRSKKIARIQAAATALRSFIQFKDGAVLTPTKPAANVDFTSDEHLENGK